MPARGVTVSMLLINDEVKDYNEHIVLTGMTDKEESSGRSALADEGSDDEESSSRSADEGSSLRDPADLPHLH